MLQHLSTTKVKDRRINNIGYLLTQFGATHLLRGILIQEGIHYNSARSKPSINASFTTYLLATTRATST
jgi:hypothetical protein